MLYSLHLAFKMICLPNAGCSFFDDLRLEPTMNFPRMFIFSEVDLAFVYLISDIGFIRRAFGVPYDVRCKFATQSQHQKPLKGIFLLAKPALARK